MIQAERRIDVRFRFQVISMTAVSFVDFRQHGLICALKKKWYKHLKLRIINKYFSVFDNFFPIRDLRDFNDFH